MDPATGGVLAMYGGRDYVTQPYNDATQSAPQAGSTFKPFALAAALENGIGLSSMWNGHSPQTVQTPDGKPYVVKNYGGESYGRISLLQATEDSVNTVYVPLSLQVGTDKVVDAARRAGVPESVHIDSGATVPLGTASPTALDMASAYATFAAGGIYRAPHTVKTVKGANGGLLLQGEDDGHDRVLPRRHRGHRLRPAEGRDQRHRLRRPGAGPPVGRQDRARPTRAARPGTPGTCPRSRPRSTSSALTRAAT